jgi:hypothetical protein
MHAASPRLEVIPRVSPPWHLLTQNRLADGIDSGTPLGAETRAPPRGRRRSGLDRGDELSRGARGTDEAGLHLRRPVLPPVSPSHVPPSHPLRLQVCRQPERRRCPLLRSPHQPLLRHSRGRGPLSAVLRRAEGGVERLQRSPFSSGSSRQLDLALVVQTALYPRQEGCQLQGFLARLGHRSRGASREGPRWRLTDCAALGSRSLSRPSREG